MEREQVVYTDVVLLVQCIDALSIIDHRQLLCVFVCAHLHIAAIAVDVVIVELSLYYMVSSELTNRAIDT